MEGANLIFLTCVRIINNFTDIFSLTNSRLTAPYMFVLGCVQVIMKSFYHNSVFDPPTLDHENCPKYWWRNALYVNTLFPVQEMVNYRLLPNLLPSSK